MKRIKLSHLVLTGALVFAMGGTATASAMITGAQIKNGSITTKDVKDRSLTAGDLAAGTLQAGAVGPAGPKGATGPKGDSALDVTLPAARVEGVATGCDEMGHHIAPDANGVKLYWTREVFDSANLHSATCAESSRLVAPRAGVYLVTASIEWWPTSDTKSRTLGIKKVGASYLAADRRDNVPSRPTQQSLSTVVRLTQGEEVEIWAYHESPLLLPLDDSLSTSAASMSWVSA